MATENPDPERFIEWYGYWDIVRPSDLSEVEMRSTDPLYGTSSIRDLVEDDVREYWDLFAQTRQIRAKMLDVRSRIAVKREGKILIPNFRLTRKHPQLVRFHLH